MKRSPIARGESRLARTGFKRSARVTLQKERDTDLEAWARAVKQRDGYTCQWPKCEFCHNYWYQPQIVTAHHKAPRSLRPDLRLDIDNGVTLCWSRHSWCHQAGRDEAIKRGFLDLTTYEAAAKEQNGSQDHL